MSVLGLVAALLLVLWAGVLLAFAGPLVARWREPVLRHPVLAIESDDWGAGPPAQAAALARLEGAFALAIVFWTERGRLFGTGEDDEAA